MHRMIQPRRSGFTLVELLVVISIVCVLTAMLAPVFMKAREKAWQVSCVGNLHRLGLATFMYVQDYDDVLPYAGDPSDLYSNYWQTHDGGRYWLESQQLPLLNIVIAPYVVNKDAWRCPSDNGFTTVDFSDNVSLDARPSSFVAFGMSYYYRTQFAFEHKRLADITGYTTAPPYLDKGPAFVNLLSDGNGSWHGGQIEHDKRYDVLMIDGHVMNETFAGYETSWSLNIDAMSAL